MAENDFQTDIRACITTLKNGGLILYPTDTVWGIGCDATNVNSIKKVFELKKRPDAKNMIVLVAEERDILHYISAPNIYALNYSKTVQKPTTIVYQDPVGLADNLVGSNRSIAIRIVRDTFCKQLIKQYGKPIVSTSANTSGGATPKNFDEISDQIKRGVDYAVHYRRSDMTPHEPSAIISFNQDGTFNILRP
jgi:L-threonylcarbamoyladenylate synthase